jgi:hypothetical protein
MKHIPLTPPKPPDFFAALSIFFILELKLPTHNPHTPQARERPAARDGSRAEPSRKPLAPGTARTRRWRANKRAGRCVLGVPVDEHAVAALAIELGLLSEREALARENLARVRGVAGALTTGAWTGRARGSIQNDSGLSQGPCGRFRAS